MDSKFLKSIIIIILAGTVAVIVMYDTGLVNKCPIRQIDITSDLKKYDQSKDPQLCAQINEKISQFNGQCKGAIEEIDCG
jgi:hypothetical protein